MGELAIISLELKSLTRQEESKRDHCHLARLPLPLWCLSCFLYGWDLTCSLWTRRGCFPWPDGSFSCPLSISLSLASIACILESQLEREGKIFWIFLILHQPAHTMKLSTVDWKSMLHFEILQTVIITYGDSRVLRP